MSRPNWCKPPVDSNEEASASWLNPPIATSSSWLHPDVASGPVKRKTTDDAPKAALLQKLPRWTAPSPSEDFASAAETPPGQTPHIVLSVGTALLACGEQALDLAEALKKKNAEFGKDILAPCSFGRGADGCTACDKLDVEWIKEYNTFMCVWNAMTTEMKTVLFSTVYDESNQSRSSSRVVCGNSVTKGFVWLVCAICFTSPHGLSTSVLMEKLTRESSTLGPVQMFPGQ